MISFWDIHHHCLGRGNGIYNVDDPLNLPESYFSIGIHPNRIKENWEQDLQKLKEISQNPYCIAIGECGLDAFVDVDEALQEKVFIEQILWANEIRKPIIIHCVRRYASLLKYAKTAKVPLIVHGFNKKKTIAKELLNKGFYLSVGKALFSNLALREMVKEIPLENIFLETDTADIDISEVYLKMAEIRNIELEYLAQQIEQNIRNVFETKF